MNNTTTDGKANEWIPTNRLQEESSCFEIRKLSPLRHISNPSFNLQGRPFDFACHAHERIPFSFCSLITVIIFVDVDNIDHLLWLPTHSVHECVYNAIHHVKQNMQSINQPTNQ